VSAEKSDGEVVVKPVQTSEQKAVARLKPRPTTFLKKLEPELKQIAKEHKLTDLELEEIIDYFFITLKAMIEDERLPKIQITNFGTFRPTIGKLNFDLNKSFFYMHRGSYDRDKLIAKVKKLWPVRQRLAKEGRGEETWKLWSKKKKSIDYIKKPQYIAKPESKK